MTNAIACGAVPRTRGRRAQDGIDVLQPRMPGEQSSAAIQGLRSARTGAEISAKVVAVTIPPNTSAVLPLIAHTGPPLVPDPVAIFVLEKVEFLASAETSPVESTIDVLPALSG